MYIINQVLMIVIHHLLFQVWAISRPKNVEVYSMKTGEKLGTLSHEIDGRLFNSLVIEVRQSEVGFDIV